MIAALERLVTPKVMRRMVEVLTLLVVLTLVLATLAIMRNAKTRGDINRVTVQLSEPPSTAELRRGLDTAIRGLTIKQRRVLLDRLLVVATPSQRKRLRTRARSLQRRDVRPAHPRIPPTRGTGRLRPTPPRMRRTPGRARPAPPPPPVVPPPAIIPVIPAAPPAVSAPPAPRTPAAPQAAEQATQPKPGKGHGNGNDQRTTSARSAAGPSKGHGKRE